MRVTRQLVAAESESFAVKLPETTAQPLARNHPRPQPTRRPVRGANAGIFPPGVWTSVREALAAPVGRLHWAGTEASARWPGFIEGAPQAGADAAAAVGAALDAEG